mmetsp:Transcript_24844/g.81285  ORF Transcript_24844/g.81285 Transcript_24844/m.81285 type:complete len:274 (+) Transcript_24844:2989-3810(+)
MQAKQRNLSRSCIRSRLQRGQQPLLRCGRGCCIPSGGARDRCGGFQHRQRGSEDVRREHRGRTAVRGGGSKPLPNLQAKNPRASPPRRKLLTLVVAPQIRPSKPVRRIPLAQIVDGKRNRCRLGRRPTERELVEHPRGRGSERFGKDAKEARRGAAAHAADRVHRLNRAGCAHERESASSPQQTELPICCPHERLWRVRSSPSLCVVRRETHPRAKCPVARASHPSLGRRLAKVLDRSLVARAGGFLRQIFLVAYYSYPCPSVHLLADVFARR